MTVPSAALLLLADGRLPTGGHAHSGGLEAAVAAGLVATAGDLGSWLAGRLATVGRVDAAFSAAAWRIAAVGLSPADPGPVLPGDHAADTSPADPWRALAAGLPSPADPWHALAAEYAARTPSPALRRASAAQGRGLLRAARRCWPTPRLDILAAALPGGPPWPVALGAAGHSAGLGAGEVALAAATAAVQGPAWAATRLLGLDPFAVAAELAALSGALDAEAAAAQRWAGPEGLVADLPSLSAPLLELGAETHAAWEVRLFAS